MCRVGVVGITGPTCSGKSTVTETLFRVLRKYRDDKCGKGNNPSETTGPERADATTPAHSLACISVSPPVICGDDYYKDDIPFSASGFQDWDSPDALRSDDLHQTIQRRKDALTASVGECVCHSLVVVVVEGFLLHALTPCWRLCDLKVVLELTKETCRTRRLDRDDWLREHPGYFDEHVWPGHVSNAPTVLPAQPSDAELAVDAELTAGDVVQAVVDGLVSFYKRSSLQSLSVSTS